MFCASIPNARQERAAVRNVFQRKHRVLHVGSLLVLLIVCGVPASHAQSCGNRRGNFEDYFGRRLEFRPARSAPSPLDPVNMMWFRTIDGSMNNVLNWQWGQAGAALRRQFAIAYSDGVSSPSGSDRLSPRVIIYCLGTGGIRPQSRGSHIHGLAVGQFLDHDIDLTVPSVRSEQYFIDVPAGDQWFDPSELGDQQIPLFRSEYESDDLGIRQQVNSITSWIDGFNIYGSDETTASSLRAHSGGLMLESEGGLLPIGDDGFFLAGDVRANEQIGLTALHTLFVREHNQIARRLTNDSNVAAEGNIALKDAFFNPDEIKAHGIDSVIKGLTVQTAQEVDTKIIDDVRNFLFGNPGHGGFDLASLNLQRGRDHGLPDLNTIRVAVGLPAHQSFAELTSDPAIQVALSEAFDSVDNIDAWVGMLADIGNLPGNVFVVSGQSKPRRSRGRSVPGERSSLSEIANWSQFLLPGWLNAFDTLGRTL